MAGEGSQAITSGSIGVAGTGASYTESGATNLGDSKITVAKGGSLVVGDPNADATISALAQQFANSVQGVATDTSTGGGGSGTIVIPGINQPVSVPTSWTAYLPWLILGGVIFLLYNFFGKRGKP